MWGWSRHDSESALIDLELVLNSFLDGFVIAVFGNFDRGLLPADVVVGQTVSQRLSPHEVDGTAKVVAGCVMGDLRFSMYILRRSTLYPLRKRVASMIQ